jgi:hypothetical protein
LPDTRFCPGCRFDYLADIRNVPPNQCPQCGRRRFEGLRFCAVCGFDFVTGVGR